MNFDLGLVENILFNGSEVDKLYLNTELIWERINTGLNAQVIDDPDLFGVLKFSISDQTEMTDGSTHWSMNARKMDGRRSATVSNWMKVLFNRAADNAYGDGQIVTIDDLEQRSIVLDESYNGEWEFTFKGLKYETIDGVPNVTYITEEIINHTISFFSEIDHRITVDSSCGVINVSLGRDVLTTASSRGIADSWIVNVYKGTEYQYVNHEVIVDQVITGTCLKTQSLDCIDTESGETLMLQGWAPEIEYDITGASVDNVELECLMTEIDWDTTGETIDWQVAGRAIGCLQHAALPKIPEVDCLQTHMCESLQTHRGECIQFEGWARETGCQVALDPGDPTALIDPITYPLFTEQGVSITDENGSAIERQGDYNVLRFETESGEGIFTETGHALERESHDHLITTEQGRPIDLNKIVYEVYEPDQLTPLTQDSRELVSTTTVSTLSATQLSVPAPAEYHVEVIMLDSNGLPIKTITHDELYVSSCVCLETESGTCFETEDHYIMQLENNPNAPGAPGVISEDTKCISTEDDECLLTHEDDPIEPEGYFSGWLGEPEPVVLLGECIETELDECIEAEDGRVIRREYIAPVIFTGDCISTEWGSCLRTEDEDPIEPEGFYGTGGVTSSGYVY